MRPAIDRQKKFLVALVFFAVMLNYVDRQIISVLKPTLQAEFDWSDRDYSHMASAFQFSAAVAFLGTGWFIDKVGLRIGFAIGVAVWSLAGMAHAFATTVAGFVGARAVLGAAESISTPASIKTSATYFEAEQRSLVIGINSTASSLGAVLTPLVIPAIALLVGWKATFLIAGGLGFVWVAFWLMIRVPPVPGAAEGTVFAPIPWRSLLRNRRQWAIVVAKMLTDQVWWFLLFFIPDLFHRLFGMDQGQLGVPVALVYTMAACGALTGGWLPSRMLANGASVNRARKTTMLVYGCLILPVPLVLYVGSPWAAAGLLGLALFAHQGFSTNIFALATDIFVARIIGSVIGIAAFFGNLSGIGMIELAGWSLDNGFGYTPMLYIAAVSYLLALLAIHLILPRIERAAPDGPVAMTAPHETKEPGA